MPSLSRRNVTLLQSHPSSLFTFAKGRDGANLQKGELVL
jgi:hypothetical protein